LSSKDWVAVRLLVSSLSMFAALSCAPFGPDETSEDADKNDQAIIGGKPALGYPEAALVNMLYGSQISSICSGAVIAPKVVLTAGHCVVGGFTGWEVVAPFANGQKAYAQKASTYDYKDTSGYVNPNQHDVGLVFLKTPIALDKYPEVASKPIASGGLLQNIGRIQDGQASWSQLFIGPQIVAQSGSGYGYPYAYVTTMKIQPGDSGGLVVGAGSHTIYAVNSGAGGGTQILARVDQVYTWIDQQVQANGGWGPSDDGSGAGGGPVDDPGDGAGGECPGGDPGGDDPGGGDPDPGAGGDDQPQGVPGGSGCYGIVETCDVGGETFLYCDGSVLWGVECADLGQTCVQVSSNDAKCQ
jgi:hypothetical protein